MVTQKCDDLYLPAWALVGMNELSMDAGMLIHLRVQTFKIDDENYIGKNTKMELNFGNSP